MEEKVLIKSAKYDAGSIFKKYAIIGFILSVITFFSIEGNWMSWRAEKWASEFRWNPRFAKEYPTKLGYVCENFFERYFLGFIIALGVLFLFVLIGALIYFALVKSEMVVTDKRVYGIVAWGKRVDLPIDSISATSTTTFFNGVSVATSSGKISFALLRNKREVYKVINDLILERQKRNVNVSVEEKIPVKNEADELKKFKDLLDSGVITQEEFDAKKKQLLGL